MVATNETMAIQYVREAFTQTHVFGMSYLITLIMLLVTLVIITRETRKWKIMALPIYIGLHIIGMKTSLAVYGVLIIIFVIEAMSIEVLGELLSSTANYIPYVGEKKLGLEKWSRERKLQKRADRKVEEISILEKTKREALAKLKSVKTLKNEKVVKKIEEKAKKEREEVRSDPKTWGYEARKDPEFWKTIGYASGKQRQIKAEEWLRKVKKKEKTPYEYKK